MKYVLAFLALLTLAPLAAACEGLSPGDELLVGDLRCTLAYLLADKSGLYFSTAGHCIKEGQGASSPGVGAFGVGALHYLVPEEGKETDGAPGDDFGLIKIDESVYDKLNPKVCELQGPTGIYDASPGSGGVRHYGYGLLLGDVGATRSRQGFNLQNNNTAFYWTGAGVPGDSGSSVLHEGGLALGVLTHLQAGVTTDTNGGTHLFRGFQLAKDLKGLDLRLVLMGEDPRAVLAEMRAAPVKTLTNSTTPTTGSTPSTPPQNQPSPTPPTGTTQNEEGIVPAADLREDGSPNEAPGLALPGIALALVAVAYAKRKRS